MWNHCVNPLRNECIDKIHTTRRRTGSRMPVGTVKTFCRRNGLQAGDLTSDTQPENISASLPEIDLISAESRGNSTTATKPESLVKPGKSDDQPICEVTITYADEPDKAAVADVLEMLRSANYRR